MKALKIFGFLVIITGIVLLGVGIYQYADASAKVSNAKDKYSYFGEYVASAYVKEDVEDAKGLMIGGGVTAAVGILIMIIGGLIKPQENNRVPKTTTTTVTSSPIVHTKPYIADEKDEIRHSQALTYMVFSAAVSGFIIVISIGVGGIISLILSLASIAVFVWRLIIFIKVHKSVKFVDPQPTEPIAIKPSPAYSLLDDAKKRVRSIYASISDNLIEIQHMASYSTNGCVEIDIEVRYFDAPSGQTISKRYNVRYKDSVWQSIDEIKNVAVTNENDNQNI